MRRTRIKICGLSREADVDAAALAGADTVGFVCVATSPRHVPRQRLAVLARRLPPYVTPVLLFVDAPAAEVRAALDEVPDALLQFHGNEDAAYCASFGRPFVKAIAMRPEVALLDCARTYERAAGLLLDTPSASHGGSGVTFDWSLVPGQRTKPLILAGGLTDSNVGAATAAVRPEAVDVSSGVEEAKGVKSAARIDRFIAAVHAADASLR